jgi:hypothetical protein
VRRERRALPRAVVIAARSRLARDVDRVPAVIEQTADPPRSNAATHPACSRRSKHFLSARRTYIYRFATTSEQCIVSELRETEVTVR